MKRLNILLWLIQGIIVGFGAIMPGISGGTLCVAFHMYYPIMAVLSSFKDNIKVYGLKLGIFILGGIIGFVGLSSIAAYFLESNSLIMICLFIGLIVGTLPDLYEEAGIKGRNKFSYVSMLIGFLLMYSLLSILTKSYVFTIAPGFSGYCLCGILWGLSFIVPGLSSSTLLLYFGIYGPMLKGISSLDVNVLIPIGIGLLMSVMTLSKVISYLHNRYYNGFSHMIIGIVLATLILLIPENYSSFNEFIYCLNATLIGGMISYYLTNLTTRLKG